MWAQLGHRKQCFDDLVCVLEECIMALQRNPEVLRQSHASHEMGLELAWLVMAVGVAQTPPELRSKWTGDGAACRLAYTRGLWMLPSSTYIPHRSRNVNLVMARARRRFSGFPPSADVPTAVRLVPAGTGNGRRPSPPCVRYFAQRSCKVQVLEW